MGAGGYGSFQGGKQQGMVISEGFLRLELLKAQLLAVQQSKQSALMMLSTVRS